jgi:hypothetical protein
MDDLSEGKSAPQGFSRRSPSWLRRTLAYIISPQIFIGGILAYGISMSVEAYKTNHAESRQDIGAVTTAVMELIKKMPRTSAGVAETTSRVEDLYIAHTSKAAQEYIAGVVGQLSVRKAKYFEDEQNALKAAEALRLSQEAKAQSEAAAKLADLARAAQAQEAARLEEEARIKAAAAEVAKIAAVRQVNLSVAISAKNAREAGQYFDQRRYDRIVK